MKKLIFLLFVFSSKALAQNTFPASGEVLINTNVTSGQAFTLGGSFIIQDKNLTSHIDNQFFVTGEGQTTPGANAAEFAFSVAGPGSSNQLHGPAFYIRGNNFSRLPNQRGVIFISAGKITSPVGDDGKVLIVSEDRDINLRAGGWDSNFNRMVIKNTGNIGVGTDNPQSKLSVKGNVESQEVQVKVTVADYVFTEDYELMSLEDLEMYIKANGHLPKIQTQKQVDENRGLVKLGELSISLMEKVEELTLHIIDLNNRIKKLEEQESMTYSNRKKNKK